MDGVGGFTIPVSKPKSYLPPQASRSEIAHYWAANGQITPGTITYTTSTNADGQVANHPFRAVPVSYQTSKGIVHGLQWVPADATQIMLTGAQLPNTPGRGAGSFGLDLLGREDDVAFKVWYDQIPHSTYSGGPDPIALAASLSALRGRSPYSACVPSPMSLTPHSSYSRPPSHAPSLSQSRQQSRSPYPPHIPSPDVRPHPHAPFPYQSRRQSRSPYPPSPDIRPHPHAPSPYQSRRQSRSPYSLHRAPTPHVPPSQIIYPHGHVFEGQRVVAPQLQAPSPFPNAPAGPVFYSSPMPIAFNEESMSDSSPYPFARSPNTTQAYAPFSMIKIQDMDQFYNQIPSMPSVLDTHDIRHQDWSMFMDDVALAWRGELPLPEFVRGHPPSIVADLINLWNNSFFLSRRVEVILYKGRERRSGPRAGTVDDQLSFPGSERANERERKYSLYLTYVSPYSIDHHRRRTSSNSLSHRAYSSSVRYPGSYNFYS